MSEADPVAAYLAEARANRDALSAAKAAYKPRGEYLPPGAAGEWVVACITAAFDHAGLLAAVEAALARHRCPERPTVCWDLDLRCPAHALIRPPTPAGWVGMLRDCADCGTRERFYCTACREDEWPCDEYQAITAALLGGADA